MDIQIINPTKKDDGIPRNFFGNIIKEKEEKETPLKLTERLFKESIDENDSLTYKIVISSKENVMFRIYGDNPEISLASIVFSDNRGKGIKRIIVFADEEKNSDWPTIYYGYEHMVGEHGRENYKKWLKAFIISYFDEREKRYYGR